MIFPRLNSVPIKLLNSFSGFKDPSTSYSELSLGRCLGLVLTSGEISNGSAKGGVAMSKRRNLI